jgi:hypothetical protein
MCRGFGFPLTKIPLRGHLTWRMSRLEFFEIKKKSN